jgi:predicted transcriptional regulator
MTNDVARESVTFRVPEDVLSEIDQIAEATERSRSYIIVRALRMYLAGEGANIKAAMHGMKQYEMGKFRTFDALLDELDAQDTEGG